MAQEQTVPSGKKNKKEMTLKRAIKLLVTLDLIIAGIISALFTTAGLMATGALANTIGMSTGNKILALVGMGLPAFLMTWLVWAFIIGIVFIMAMFLWSFFKGRMTTSKTATTEELS